MELCDPSHENSLWTCQIDHDPPAVVFPSNNLDYAAPLACVHILNTFGTQGVDPVGGPLRGTPAPPMLFSSLVLERLQQIFVHEQLRERKGHHDPDAYQSSRTPSDQRHIGQFTNV